MPSACMACLRKRTPTFSREQLARSHAIHHTSVDIIPSGEVFGLIICIIVYWGLLHLWQELCELPAAFLLWYRGRLRLILQNECNRAPITQAATKAYKGPSHQACVRNLSPLLWHFPKNIRNIIIVEYYFSSFLLP